MVHPSSRRLARLAAPVALSFACFLSAAHAQETMEPAANVNGTLGLGQIVSAEAMGQGRLTVNMRGNLYQQGKDFPGAPKKNSQITTGTGAFAFGINPYVDGFIGLAAYNLSGAVTDNGTGLGTVAGGIQASAPFSDKIPARLGVQLAVLKGAAKTQIDSNHADGYNYFETRTGTDFTLRIVQSIVFNGMGMSLKLHLNEGVATSLEDKKYALLLQGAAFEFAPSPSIILGTEFHSRTVLRDNRDSDPMWMVPSITFRSLNHINAQVGAELSLTQERVGEPSRALEPWRMFANLTWSLNPKIARDKEDKARQDSLARVLMEEQMRRSQHLADSLARKAREDSLARALSDEAARRRADSLAAKARRDSLDLAEARKKLEEEKSHRTDWEKEFLRTGVLNLEALYFETGKAEISINSKPYLNLVGKMLSKYPKLQMEIGGHTDNVGSATTNLKLSQDRSDAVRMYLIAAYSELNGRLTAHGYGMTVPKATNRTAEGRQINRRVEIAVTNKEALKEYE